MRRPSYCSSLPEKSPFQQPNLAENLMTTLSPPANPESDPTVKAVFDDIRATRGNDFINNFWLYLANEPTLLKDTWAEIKAVLATESLLDPKTKEMIYVAVSIANACSYCIHSHSAAAKAKGMSPGEHAELIRIVSLAAKTNHMVTAMQVPVDDAFDCSVS